MEYPIAPPYPLQEPLTLQLQDNISQQLLVQPCERMEFFVSSFRPTYKGRQDAGSLSHPVFPTKVMICHQRLFIVGLLPGESFLGIFILFHSP
jgi:hypothetical protein